MYHSFWGKSHAACVPTWHPLAYHSADVAAVTRAYLELNPLVLKQLALLGGLTAEQALSLMTFLAGAHDVGKFSPGFQAKVPERFPVAVLGEKRPAEIHDHQVMGVSLLVGWLFAKLKTGEPLKAKSLERSLERIANLACAHHGRPVVVHSGLFKMFPGAEEVAKSFLGDIWQLSGAEDVPLEFFNSPNSVYQFSWLAAGVITLADWIGSSREHFPYCCDELSLETYFAKAQGRARAALVACQQVESAPSATHGFSALFGELGLTPTPLQVYADTVPLSGHPAPQLFILEDETGAGKTEAALTLASRLLSKGFCRGLFFCLPTQTTANAVFHRIAPLAKLLFREGAQPSLSLAHGQAKLALERLCQDEPFADSLSNQLWGWAQERNKTALLADLGVGTIDQVVLAGLPARHATLRTLGLAQKLLIIDEAHACDTYQLGLLVAVLEEHARLGGSAVILSATLPKSIKVKLVASFNKGLGKPPAELNGDEYPLATFAAGGAAVETPIGARKAPRELRFSAITGKAVKRLVASAVAANKCICILRNTVALAQSLYDELEAEYPGKVMLAHARFMTGHRIDNDEKLLRLFGKKSTGATRAGLIVIATQVVEASLDVDFDELITDLAPIDSLLQRAGRWRRHARDRFGVLKAVGADERPVGVVHVLVPDPNKDTFIGQLSKGTAFVYPDVAVLWRSARVVTEWQTIEVPGQVRAAVDFVYGDLDQEVPEWLDCLADKNRGERLAASQMAYSSTVSWELGYHPQAGIEEGERAVTRLGEASVSVILCQSGMPLLTVAAISQLSLRLAQVKGEPLVENKVYLDLAFDADTGVWVGEVNKADPSCKYHFVRYSKLRGLSFSG